MLSSSSSSSLSSSSLSSSSLSSSSSSSSSTTMADVSLGLLSICKTVHRCRISLWIFSSVMLGSPSSFLYSDSMYLS
eukprot:3136075-Prymnesium_polylepis.1